MDLFLAAVHKNKSQGGIDQESSSSSDDGAMMLQSLCDEAKDYLKMLHSIVSGEWSRESPLSEDERALRGRAEGLCRRLVGCVASSFERPSTLSATPTSLYGIGRSPPVCRLTYTLTQPPSIRLL